MCTNYKETPTKLTFNDGSRIIIDYPSKLELSKQNETKISFNKIPEKWKNRLPTTSLKAFYEITRIASEILVCLELIKKSHNKNRRILKVIPKDTTKDTFLCRVALQFPDYLLSDSSEVSWLLEEEILTQYTIHCKTHPINEKNVNIITKFPLIFVLGDTTFNSSCCPNEVGALHLNADIIVHYGADVCMSMGTKLPVIYSFCLEEENKNENFVIKCANSISQKIRDNPNIKDKQLQLLVVYEIRFYTLVFPLVILLRQISPTLTIILGTMQQLEYIFMDKNNRVELSSSIEKNDNNSSIFLHGFHASVASSSLPEYTLLYIGDTTDNNRQFLYILIRCLTCPSHPMRQCWSYNPFLDKLETNHATNNSVNKFLSRRFYLIQKARQARIFGIVIGSYLSHQNQILSSSNSTLLILITSLRNKIESKGNACHVFNVGSIHVSKLANYAEIECFILLSCRETSILPNERDYHVPIVTPWEVNVALDIVNWNDQYWSCDLEDYIIRKKENNMLHIDTERLSNNEEVYIQDTGKSDDTPYYDTISGTYKRRSITSSESCQRNLSRINNDGNLIQYHSPSAEFWKMKEYKGLQARIGKDECHEAVDGDVGIASDYGGK